MALKRSGVRASFAPSIRSFVPRLGRFTLRSALSFFRLPLLSLLPFLCLLIVLFDPLGSAHGQQAAPSANVKRPPTDVFLFIHPDGPSTARIGLDYHKRLPHSQVRRVIEKLLAASGWKLISEPKITEKTVRPEDPRRFPPTTGALFSVSDAPQFRDNAPMLAPYLQAFQSWNRLEILFVTSDLQPYNGVTNFRSSALDVTLAKSEGIYSYLVTIREHAKDLPPLIRDAPSDAVRPKEPEPESTAREGDLHDTVAAQSSPSLFQPILFIVIGSMLTGGVSVYFLIRRHQMHLKPRRLP